MRVIRNQTSACEIDFVLPLTVFRSWELLPFNSVTSALFNESSHLLISKSDKTQTQTGLQLRQITKYLAAFVKCQHGRCSGSPCCPAGR